MLTERPAGTELSGTRAPVAPVAACNSLSMSNERLLTVRETADRLRVSPMTVRRRIDGGELRALQLGGPGRPVRIAEADLDAWLYGAETRQIEEEAGS